MMTNRIAVPFLMGVSAFALTGLSAPVAAQDNPAPCKDGTARPCTPAADEQLIVVTGSRIGRVGYDSVQPTIALTAQQIDQRGYTNVGQALSEIPAFGVPGNSPVGTQSGFGAGQTFVDLFSLGTQRTLTLINGRRFVSSNTPSIFGPVDAGSQVDLNVIPEELVERIDTVAVGGAPIYGSDAIAGTVNIVLKRNYEGLKLGAQDGISQRGDGREYRFKGLWGTNFAAGRGNIVVAGEYTKGRGIATSDRFLTGSSGPFFTTTAKEDAPYLQELYYAHRYNIFTAAGIPLVGDSIPEFAGVQDAAGNILKFNDRGRLVPLDYGTRTGSLIESAGGNGFPIDDYGNLLTNTQRYLGNIIGSYQLTDHVRLFGEGWYSHSKATNLRDQPVYNTVLFDDAGAPDGNILLNLNNPYLNPADRTTIAENLGVDPNNITDADQFLLTRANVDLASGRATSTVEVYRIVAGLDGDFNIGTRSFQWEVSANYGHSTTRSQSRELVQQNFLNAIDAVRDDSGNIVCRPGYTNANVATLNPTCSPLDLFGVNQFSQAALDYVTAIARPVSKNSQLVLNGNIKGPIARLPGGDVEFVVGYEHRRERTSFDPGVFYFGEDNGDGTRSQYGRTIPIDPIAGGFHTDEGFTEIRVPLISPEMNFSFVHMLELDGAARYVHNSLSGGDWTWTAGGIFAPIQDISFRGNFTRSIRSPAITEVFNPTSPAFESGNDPCDARFISSGPNPTARAANCANAGITQPFTSNYSDFTVPILVSGNPDLKNEVADSWTAGAKIQPRFIPGLVIAADYVNIRLKKAIVSLGGNDVLNACYDASDFPNNFCGLVTRDGDGQITEIREGYYNAATQKFSGVTVTAAYRFDLGKLGLKGTPGTIGLSMNYYHVIKQEQRVATGDLSTTRGAIGNPKNSFTADINYSNRNFDFLWQTQYYGPSKFDANAAPDTYQYPSVGGWFVFNSSIGIKVADRIDLRFIVDNVFDAKPPFPAPAAGGTITYYSGILGRYFRAAVDLTF